MLTRVEDSGDNLVEQYKYDALGRRIVADDGTNQTWFYLYRAGAETVGAEKRGKGERGKGYSP